MILTIIFLFLALAIFLFGCFAASSDAQGAIVFIFVIPIVLGLLGYNIYWSRKNFKRVMNVISISGFIFTTLFVVFAFVPGLNLFPATVIGFVARGFEAVTGQTPYAWSREKNDILSMLNRDVKTPETIDMSSYTSSRSWQKVCFFGPYSTDAQVSETLGFHFKLSEISSIASSDAINTIVFIENKRVVYFLDYPRKYDFWKLSGKCFEKANARFKEEKPGSKVYISM